MKKKTPRHEEKLILSKPWEKRCFLAQQHLDHQLWNSSVYISRFLRVQQLCQIGQKSIVFLIDISEIDIFAPLIFLYLFVGKMKLLHDKCLTCSIWLPQSLECGSSMTSPFRDHRGCHHLFAPLTKGRAQWKSWNKSKLGILFIRKCGVKSLRKKLRKWEIWITPYPSVRQLQSPLEGLASEQRPTCLPLLHW